MAIVGNLERLRVVFLVFLNKLRLLDGRLLHTCDSHWPVLSLKLCELAFDLGKFILEEELFLGCILDEDLVNAGEEVANVSPPEGE